jgi:hypothetical protein
MPLMELPFPQRLFDVLGNRMSIDSYVFEYFQNGGSTRYMNNPAKTGPQRPGPPTIVEVRFGAVGRMGRMHPADGVPPDEPP